MKEENLQTYSPKTFFKASVVVVEKKLLAQRKQVYIENEAFDDANLYHHAILFRFYEADNTNNDNLLVEIDMEAPMNSIAPNLDSLKKPPSSIEEINEIFASSTHGAGCNVRSYSFDISDYAFVSRYTMGYYIKDISNEEFQSLLNFMCAYESMFGCIYSLANVIRRPDLTPDYKIDMHSFLSNVIVPYLHDNNCYSFVQRVLNQLLMSKDELVTYFMPRRNYVSQFVQSNTEIVKIDTSTQSGINMIFFYFKKLRYWGTKFSPPNSNLANLKRLEKMVLAQKMLNFQYTIFFQWNCHSKQIDYFQIRRPPSMFVSFVTYQIRYALEESELFM